MRISRLYVDGFRRFENQEICFEKETTVLAGANNSGKTSLIDILRIVLQSGKDVGADDFSAQRRRVWTTQLIQAGLEGEQPFLDFLEGAEDLFNVPKVEVRLQVSYDPATDDIREFADFLMDLDLSSNAFYFRYRFAPNSVKLVAALSDLYSFVESEILKEGWSVPDDVDTNTAGFHALQAAFSKALLASCVTETHFADATYENLIALERKRFLRLFNFRLIKASRPLDDTVDDRTGALGKKLVEVSKDSDGWKAILETFPDQVLAAINGTNIKAVASAEALKSLNAVVNSISMTNGTSHSDLFLDFQVSEEDATILIARAMRTRYSGNGVPLGEASQGLGYSNLIYLHLEVESFLLSAGKSENSFLVNLVIVEEPESHMHPQMQNAFIKHLFGRVEASSRFQAVVTTHSSEIVRSSRIQLLRVLKVLDGECNIIDLRDFHEREVANQSSEKRRLFNFLYAINFADVLFADKVILYEGDTERMYIQALIQERADLSGLRTQYVSYVQVGGAYAHIYVPFIVDTLGIKTAVITDIDYEKNSQTASVRELNTLSSTNATLNHLFAIEDGTSTSNPTLETFFTSIGGSRKGVAEVTGKPLLGISYQAESEGYARTLEEAILATLTSMKVWESKTGEEWRTYRDESALKYVVPTSSERPTIREIVAATSDKKTDFMYSLLLKEDFHASVPPYILASLKWLNA